MGCAVPMTAGAQSTSTAYVLRVHELLRAMLRAIFSLWQVRSGGQKGIFVPLSPSSAETSWTAQAGGRRIRL